MFLTKARSVQFKICSKVRSRTVILEDRENLPSLFGFGEERVLTAERPDKQPVLLVTRFGTCTIGWPPADAFTAPRLPSVS